MSEPMTCSVKGCDKPAFVQVNTMVGAAASAGIRMEPRCDEHNPYIPVALREQVLRDTVKDLEDQNRVLRERLADADAIIGLDDVLPPTEDKQAERDDEIYNLCRIYWVKYKNRPAEQADPRKEKV